MTFRIKPRTIKFHKRNKRTGHFQSQRRLMTEALAQGRTDLVEKLVRL